jgi:hypothetical protein
MTQGPFLYDEGPAPLHTGTPRSRQGWLIGGLVAIVVLAVAMVGVLLLVKGTAEEQSTEVTTVFLAALDHGDVDTAHGLLCERERTRLTPDEVAAAYDVSGSGEVLGAQDDPDAGAKVQQVRVRWADGRTSVYSVISEDGARICGVD